MIQLIYQPNKQRNDEVTSAVSEILAQVRGTKSNEVAAKPADKRATVELDPELRSVIQSFEDAKELAKFAEQQKDLAEAVLREALGDAKVGTINGEVVLTVNNGSNTRVDKGILQDAFPEAYTKALVRKTYTYLKGHLEG